ncbi:C11orf16 [Bugula neritina]|uniref:C11orf16 n=1 Tax=Bugula neritina TaxID=10212 RepID=A0A7J7K519_BUGNE|nr:C11orf16 [Bugula neritina]
MYCRLAIVKQHLKEYLQKMAFRGGCKFNMVEFSTDVTQWSDEMVQCLPETVTVACDWINQLEAKTGTNTESALLAAYNDDDCEAVYLITDGLPDSKPSEILDRVAYVCRGRPCHCIYLTGATVDKAATNFLQDLATDTYGSFMIATVTSHGSIERITPVYKASHGAGAVIRTTSNQVYAGNHKQCSVTSTLDHPPPVTTVLQGTTPTGIVYPYAATVVPLVCPPLYPRCPQSELLILGSSTLILLALCLALVYSLMMRVVCLRKGFSDTTYQETFVFDIVQLDDGKRHSIMKGDKVLAPTEVGSDLYEPGTVIDGQERRDSNNDFEDKKLVVMFATGKSTDVEAGQAVWIDQLLYDRTAFELKLPRKTREQIVDTVARYPEDSFPGYPVSGADKDPVAWELPRKFHTVGRDATFQPHNGLAIHKESYEDYRPYVKDFSQTSYTTKEEVERKIPGTNLTQLELEEKVGAQLDAHRYDLEEHDIRLQRQRHLEEKKRQWRNRQQNKNESREEIDRDISILEAELKYKMKLREKAIDRKRQEIDDEIEIKIQERDQLMEDRRRSLERSQSREPSYRRRSRSRSFSTERAPSFGHVSPRSPRNRRHSWSPERSVNFDESLNSHHHYYYNNPFSTSDSGFDEQLSYTKDSATNTPVIRNGRKLSLKKTKEERPPWKYWKAESVPDLIEPPFHEPYSQSAVAEPLEMRSTTVKSGVLEWGDAHFNKVVPNGRTNYCQRYVKTAPAGIKSVSFQDNPQVHVARGSNLVTHASREEKKLLLRQNESQSRLKSPDPSVYYRYGDGVGESMQVIIQFNEFMSAHNSCSG